MGYLVCEKCGGAYELQPGESPEDFETCACGGSLKYMENLDSKKSEPKKSQKNPFAKIKSKTKNSFSKDSDNKESVKFCKKCGFKNKSDALFCKKCGKTFKKHKRFFKRINDEINILALFVGLLAFLFVLIFSSILFFPLLDSNFWLYAALIILCPLFFGAIVTGIFTGKNYYSGAVNGGFLTLVSVVLIGFILTTLWFVAMGLVYAISNAISSIGTSAESSTGSSAISSTSSGSTGSSGSTASQPNSGMNSVSESYSTIANNASQVVTTSSNTIPTDIILSIVFIILFIAAGPVGGVVGVYLNKSFRKILNRE